MRIDVHNRCSDFNSYRAARVKSLFNAETGANFDLVADLPVDDPDWCLGLIVGPSGSGKTSMGRQFWGADAIGDFDDWPNDRPIIDAIAPGGDFNEVTAALAGVGLGDVPTWLRPYHVLSNGEKFRTNLARVLCDKPDHIVIDEFSSVVDRQIAKFGALAFAKSWKRLAKGANKQCILLSCHYDIIDWLEPDWVFDTATGKYAGRGLWRRPKFDLEVWQTDWRYWHLFEPHHYLKLPKMIASRCFVGTVDGELVAHLAITPKFEVGGVRACRMVIMPEWQGAGIGMRFLNHICEREVNGEGKYGDRVKAVYFHTSHPGLVAAMKRDPHWRCVSARLLGDSKARSKRSIGKSNQKRIQEGRATVVKGSPGYGGHFRSAQGWKYTKVGAG